MKRLAGIFAGLSLAILIAGLLLWLRVVPLTPTVPPETALTGPVDRIVVEKAARRLTLWQNGQPVRVWPIALGFAPEGDKERQGDGKTPEGRFRIDRRNAASAYHLSLGLDYPQPEDRARAQAAGYSPGGDIMIHGQPNVVPEGMRVPGDWTAGCIALTNDQIRQLWEVAPIGTEVEVRP